jgi:hypothetical protein
VATLRFDPKALDFRAQRQLEVYGWKAELRRRLRAGFLLQLAEQQHLIQYRLHAAARLADQVNKPTGLH